MFDECHDAAGHEPRRTDGLACARDFNHLDNSATRSDLDATPRARRDDLVSTRTVVCRHHDLDAVTLHVQSVVRSAPEQHDWTIRRRPRRRGSILIDSVRKQIQERIDRLLGEAEKLRSALAALGTDGASPAAAATGANSEAVHTDAHRRTRSTPTSGGRRRTPAGATKSKVLATLSADKKA